MNDVQRLGGSANVWFCLLSLVEVSRKRLRQVSSLETASRLDFDLTLFWCFWKLCSCSPTDLQPLFWSAHDPYVLHNALGLNLLSKSSSINAWIFDLISIYNLPNLIQITYFCTLMPWYEFDDGKLYNETWNHHKIFVINAFGFLFDLFWFKSN